MKEKKKVRAIRARPGEGVPKRAGPTLEGGKISGGGRKVHSFRGSWKLSFKRERIAKIDKTNE